MEKIISKKELNKITVIDSEIISDQTDLNVKTDVDNLISDIKVKSNEKELNND